MEMVSPTFINAISTIKWWHITIFLISVHFIKAIYLRVKYLSTRVPVLPKGTKRLVNYPNPKPVIIDFSNYYEIHYTFFSILLVPYEKNVLYVDDLMHENNPDKTTVTKDYVLRYQERLHSYIHNKLNLSIIKNSNFCSGIIFKIFKGFCEIAIHGFVFFPNIVSGMVANFEQCFYFIEGVESFFKILPNNNAFCKVFLWHFYEEIEHNQESSYLFLVYQGTWKYFYILLSAPLVFSMLLITITFQLITIIFMTPIIWKIPFLLKSFNHLCQWIAMIILSALLLFFNINASDEVINKDLALFRKLFQERFKESLEGKNVTVNFE